MTRARVATLSFLVMESLIWYAAAQLLAGGAGGRGPAYLTVLLATLGGFGLARALQRFDMSPVLLAVIGGVATVLPLVVLLNIQYNTGGNPLSFDWLAGMVESPDTYLQTRWPQTWGVVIVSAAWLRSVWAAQQDFGYGMVLTSFSVGLLMFAVMLVFGQGTRAGERVNTAALPFFLTGLLTLALVHLQEAEETDSGFARGPWLPIVLGTVGGLGVVSAALGLFPLGLFYRLLAPVGTVLLRVLDLVILAIAFPISWIATFILTRLFGSSMEWPQMNQVATEGASEIQDQGERSAALAFLLVIIKFLFLLVIVALVAYIIYRVFRHLRQRSGRRDAVEEFVEREGDLGEDLNALLRGILGRFRRTRPGGAEPDLPAGVRRVRRVYLDLLEDAETRGTARPPAATPTEFAPDLVQTYADPFPDRISDRFAAARYGRVEPSAEEIAALERELSATRRSGSAR